MTTENARKLAAMKPQQANSGAGNGITQKLNATAPSGGQKKKGSSYRAMLMQAGVGAAAKASTTPTTPQTPDALHRSGLGGGAFKKLEKI